MTFHARQRLWYWRVVHYLSIVRLRRRVVFGLALLGVLVAWIVTSNMTPVYSSRATVDVGGNVDEMGYITNGLSPQEIRNLHYRPNTNYGTW
jgi:uncharacterized protein involved in exopolysaccharide biosynthesis